MIHSSSLRLCRTPLRGRVQSTAVASSTSSLCCFLSSLLQRCLRCLAGSTIAHRSWKLSRFKVFAVRRKGYHIEHDPTLPWSTFLPRRSRWRYTHVSLSCTWTSWFGHHEGCLVLRSIQCWRSFWGSPELAASDPADSVTALFALVCFSTTSSVHRSHNSHADTLCRGRIKCIGTCCSLRSASSTPAAHLHTPPHSRPRHRQDQTSSA